MRKYLLLFSLQLIAISYDPILRYFQREVAEKFRFLYGLIFFQVIAFAIFGILLFCLLDEKRKVLDTTERTNYPILMIVNLGFIIYRIWHQLQVLPMSIILVSIFGMFLIRNYRNSADHNDR